MKDAQASEELHDTALAYNRAIALADFQAGFLARTSHELRAPFNQIISLHQLILSDLCESPEEERTFLAQAQAATQRVLKNLDLLISISNLVVGRVQPALQPVQVASLLLQVEPLIQLQAANRSCRLELIQPEDDWYIQGDSHWLRQALVMLVEGAIISESKQIKIQSQQTAPETIEIWITHDGSAAAWQLPPLDEPSPTAGFSTQAAELPLPFSVASRLQLTAQILSVMKGEISLSHSNSASATPSSAEASTRLVIALPIARP